MSVTAVTYWTVVCDRCDRTAFTDEFTAYAFPEAALVAFDQGGPEVADEWMQTEDDDPADVQHYCGDCWTWTAGEQAPKP